MEKRATERGGHLPPLGRKPRQLRTPPPPLAATRPRIPDWSARESPGRLGRSSPALSAADAADAASPRPAPRAGKKSRASAGTEGARGLQCTDARRQVKAMEQKSN